MKKQLPYSWVAQFTLALICVSVGVNFLSLGVRDIYVHILYLNPGELFNIVLLQQSILFGFVGTILVCLGIIMWASVKVQTEALINEMKPDYSHVKRVLLSIILFIVLGAIIIALANYQIWTIIRPDIHSII